LCQQRLRRTRTAPQGRLQVHTSLCLTATEECPTRPAWRQPRTADQRASRLLAGRWILALDPSSPRLRLPPAAHLRSHCSVAGRAQIQRRQGFCKTSATSQPQCSQRAQRNAARRPPPCYWKVRRQPLRILRRWLAMKVRPATRRHPIPASAAPHLAAARKMEMQLRPIWLLLSLVAQNLLRTEIVR